MEAKFDIKNLKFSESNVGSTIKCTKKLYCWQFDLNGKNHLLELYESILSLKKKIILDQEVLYDITIEKAFAVKFEIGHINCAIVQRKEGYEFSIENIVFNHLLEVEKNKSQFNNSEHKPSSRSYIIEPASSLSANKENNNGSFFIESGIVKTPSEAPSPHYNFVIKSSTSSSVVTANNSLRGSVNSSVANSPLVPRRFDFGDIKVFKSPRTPNLKEANKISNSTKDLSYISNEDNFSLDETSPANNKSKSSNNDLIDFTKTETISSNNAITNKR